MNGHTPTPRFSIGTCAALAAMLRDRKARELAVKIGACLFPAGPERALAIALALGDWSATERWIKGTPEERAMMAELLEYVERYNPFGVDDDWPIALIRNQARSSNAPLLAAQLRWAADQIDAGAWEVRIERELVHAFRIAEGTAAWSDPRTELEVAA